MTDAWRIFLCLTACGLGFAVLQRVAGRKNPIPAGHILAILFGLYTACLFLLLTARPIMAALCALSLLTLLLTLNRAKEKALREPLIPADAYLLPLVFRYPHLYFPFLPIRVITASLAILALAFATLLLLEKPLPLIRTVNAAASLICAVLLFPAIIFLLRAGFFPTISARLLSIFPCSSDAARDAAHNGLMAPLLNHFVWAAAFTRSQPDFLRTPHIRPTASSFPESMEQTLADMENTPPDQLPHIILIQAESFCDIRKHVDEPLKNALTGFLPNWDDLKTLGRAFDPPENAYGAYTMRTEFAMLTGLHAGDLGPWAYNPYILAAKHPLWSLARHLEARGYNTLCVHPYHKDFFSREKIIPNLGFQRFLGLEELDYLKKFGPYTSDFALSNMVTTELTASEQSGRPLFCFIITMEAHGPWLPGRLTEEAMRDTLPELTADMCEQSLRMYLCHLRHMDMMFKIVAEENTKTERKERERKVWAYGDHMPGVA